MKASSISSKQKELVQSIIQNRNYSRDQKSNLLLEQLNAGKDILFFTPQNQPEHSTSWMFWHGHDALFAKVFSSWKPAFENLLLQALIKEPQKALHLIELGCPVHRCKGIFLDYAWKNRPLLDKLLEFGVGWKSNHSVEEMRALGYRQFKEFAQALEYIEQYKTNHLVRKPVHPSEQKINWQSFANAYLNDDRKNAVAWIKQHHHKINLIEVLRRDMSHPQFIELVQELGDLMKKEWWKEILLRNGGLFDQLRNKQKNIKSDQLFRIYRLSTESGFPHVFWAQQDRWLRQHDHHDLLAAIEKNILLNAVDHTNLTPSSVSKRKM